MHGYKSLLCLAFFLHFANQKNIMLSWSLLKTISSSGNQQYYLGFQIASYGTSYGKTRMNFLASPYFQAFVWDKHTITPLLKIFHFKINLAGGMPCISLWRLAMKCGLLKLCNFLKYIKYFIFEANILIMLFTAFKKN